MERISYARVLVEVDVSLPLIEYVEIALPDGTYMQRIDYEWPPKFCHHYLKFRHIEDQCRAKQEQHEDEFHQAPRRRQNRGRPVGDPKPLVPTNTKDSSQMMQMNIQEEGQTSHKLDGGSTNRIECLNELVGKGDTGLTEDPVEITAFTTMLTIVYAKNEAQLRKSLWSNLIQIGRNIQEPWLLSGDFNDVLTAEHRVGSQKYGGLETEFMNSGVSDHTPLITDCKIVVNMKPRPFKLYSTVMQHPEFSDKVQKARGKLEIIQVNLCQSPFDQLLIAAEKDTLQEITKWGLIEEQALRQRSRAIWIKEGYANTKNFHAQLKMRIRRNSIHSIYTKWGTKLTDPNDIEQEFISVFKCLMGSSTGSLPCPDISVIQQGPCLSYEQKCSLVKEVTIHEVNTTIKGLQKEKAPGVDGYPVDFFNHQWPTVQELTCKAVLKFFRHGIGSPLTFINWVMECVSTVSYSLVMNGSLTEPFQGKKASGRGIPCHPTCLFWLWSIYIENDLLMFCKAEVKSIQLIQQAFTKFSNASGLQANCDKSFVFFSGDLLALPKGLWKIMESRRYVSTITSTQGSLGDRLGEMVHIGKFSIKSPEETLTHLLFDCPITNLLWSRMLKWAGEHRPISCWQEEVAQAVKWAKKQVWQGPSRGATVNIMWSKMKRLKEKLILLEIQKWSLVEEKVLRQKSRARWIYSGDANSKLMGDCHEEMPCPNARIIKNGPCLDREQQLALMLRRTYMQLYNNFFSVGVMMKAWNCKAITLVPKIPSPTQQCMPLVEKITTKMRCWSTRLLFYSGRLQLIKFVLFGMQSYWAQIFVLPKRVIKLIEAACMNFLWTGKGEMSKKARVALQHQFPRVPWKNLTLHSSQVWGSIAPLVAPASKCWTMGPRAGVDLSQGKVEKWHG
ncbi:hypothetical protein KY290_017492 [Solanum tuberosum]|uniref:Non-LTR retroelement reverse transcriptase n=1 Tax=Solanum tuberosum TaxID=4113 RepID=A0ABQ7VBG1_SOLTU|nr:hypothetical protein KY290_017492 [Solanum tuberosum]